MYMWIARIVQFLSVRDAGVIIRRKDWIIKIVNLTKGVMYA